jgi:hypothetical protein
MSVTSDNKTDGSLRAAVKITDPKTLKGEVKIEEHFGSNQSNLNVEDETRQKRIADASEKQRQIWDKQIRTIFSTRA